MVKYQAEGAGPEKPAFCSPESQASSPSRPVPQPNQARWVAAPSLMHRILTIKAWAGRLDRLTQMDSVSMQLVSFDTQKMMNPDVQGRDDQRGTLFGTEVRAYLMHKWEGKCAYCGKEGKLEVEHLTPRARGGTNRISNLVMSCQFCNSKKGAQSLGDFLVKKPAQLGWIQEQQKANLHDSAAVNATKYRLIKELKQFGYPVEIGSGAPTSFNRRSQDYDKVHWVDAACVGESGAVVLIKPLKPLLIKCMGRGTRQSCGTDKYGFPIRHKTRQKVFFGCQTGDIVRAEVPFWQVRRKLYRPHRGAGKAELQTWKL